MGVPALFRWLTKKYPKITSVVVEEKNIQVEGFNLDIDTSRPNPNGFEIDNLYLDMNGIVHPCCHPENRPPPPTEDAMFAEIFKYIDRIMAMVRPRKLLYMAIDGVAPRAKMNQQRSRRFRAAADADAKDASETAVRSQYEEEHGVRLATKKEEFDSNCITPGTPFMNRLAECLRYYAAKKLTEDAGWAKLKVIISDASVPGEGEHKIMDYIRRQRALRDHDPNTSHVLHGLDADLIMLALATHEPHFKILREDVFSQEGNNRGCFICGQAGHLASECTGQKLKIDDVGEEKDGGILVKPHIFLHLNILREYLEAELQLYDVGFPFSLERAIDDWIFLIFFVGNDFLPHLPSLEIREDAIDRLVELWKKVVPNVGGWLTDSGSINLGRVEVLMRGLAEVEDEIFRQRRAREERLRENRKRRKEEQRQRQSGQSNNNTRFNADGEIPQLITATVGNEVYAYPNQQKENQMKFMRDRLKVLEAARAQATAKDAKTTVANKAAADALRNSLKPSSTNKTDGVVNSNNSSPSKSTEEPVYAGVKRKAEELEKDGEDPGRDTSTGDEAARAPGEGGEEDTEGGAVVVDATVVTDIPAAELKKVVDDDEEPLDTIRLWEPGWKQRYYRSKFGIGPDDNQVRAYIAIKYVEGLCWVLAYYYQGVPSWKWYYPYYYSPFASDFTTMGKLDVKFELGEPFRPFEQLMAVFPPRSRHHIPSAFHSLMTTADSPIIDFYPLGFEVDMDGKKYSWQGVAKLSWVDEKRLLDAMIPLYSKLTPEEVLRNQFGFDMLCLSTSHNLFESLCKLYGKKAIADAVQVEPKLSQGMYGSVLPDPDLCPPGTKFPSQLTSQSLNDIEGVKSLSVLYLMPKFPSGHIFRAELKQGVQFPPRVLSPDDIHWIHNKARLGRRGPANMQIAKRMIAPHIPPTTSVSSAAAPNSQYGQQAQRQQEYMPYYQQYGYPPYYMDAPPQQYQTPYGTQYTQPFAPRSMYPPYVPASSAPGAQGGNNAGQYAAYGQNQMTYGYNASQSPLNQHAQQPQPYTSLSQQAGMYSGTIGNFMNHAEQPPRAQHPQQQPQQQGYPQYNQGYYAYGNQPLAGSRGSQQGYWNQ